LDTSVGKLRVLDNSIEDEKKERLIILMHGCPSECTELLHFFTPLGFYRYRVVAFDFPGYGGSPGEKLASRSDKIHVPKGPAECALAVMKKLGYQKASFGGYDWGAGVALGIGLKYPKCVQKIISLLPSYNPTNNQELSTMIPATLVIWVKQDLFHSWARWQSFAKQIPNKKIELIDAKIWKEGMSAGAYHTFRDQIGRAILMFLGHSDPMVDSSKIKEDVVKLDTDIHGKVIEKKQLIVFGDDEDLQKV
jgi:pimeloyl-ACP methyl ester carboxylesterase